MEEWTSEEEQNLDETAGSESSDSTSGFPCPEEMSSTASMCSSGHHTSNRKMSLNFVPHWLISTSVSSWVRSAVTEEDIVTIMDSPPGPSGQDGHLEPSQDHLGAEQNETRSDQKTGSVSPKEMSLTASVGSSEVVTDALLLAMGTIRVILGQRRLSWQLLTRISMRTRLRRKQKNLLKRLQGMYAFTWEIKLIWPDWRKKKQSDYMKPDQKVFSAEENRWRMSDPARPFPLYYLVFPLPPLLLYFTSLSSSPNPHLPSTPPHPLPFSQLPHYSHHNLFCTHDIYGIHVPGEGSLLCSSSWGFFHLSPLKGLFGSFSLSESKHSGCCMLYCKVPWISDL